MRKILGVALLSSPFVGLLAISAVSGWLLYALIALGMTAVIIAVIVAGTILLEDK